MTLRIWITLLLFHMSFLVVESHKVDARTLRIQSDGAGDCPSIQAGIDEAFPGDTVLVDPGRYFENIQFNGVDIVLKSLLGAEVTIIDGSGLDSATVAFRFGESRACILEGFTISGGRGGTSNTEESKKGGGIFVQDAEPIIRFNRITQNSIMAVPPDFGSYGAGIFVRGDFRRITRSPLIFGNIVEGNISSGNGGGIAVCDNAIAEIRDNIIRQNVAMDGDGGGIWVRISENGSVISNNSVEFNVAGDHGGGIYAGGSVFPGTLLIEIGENLVRANESRGRAQTGDSGGGIWLCNTSSRVFSNTIVGNRGGRNEDYGGGVVLICPGSPILERNIIALSTMGGGILCDNSTTPTIRNNLAWMNSGPDGIRACQEWYLSNGNIQADPLFCGAAQGDFSLPPNSPALTHPAGPLGAVTNPGCKVAIEATTWGAIKSRHWSGD